MTNDGAGDAYAVWVSDDFVVHNLESFWYEEDDAAKPGEIIDWTPYMLEWYIPVLYVGETRWIDVWVRDVEADEPVCNEMIVDIMTPADSDWWGIEHPDGVAAEVCIDKPYACELYCQ